MIRKLCLILFSIFLSFFHPCKTSIQEQRRLMKNSNSSLDIPSLIEKTNKSFSKKSARFIKRVSNAVNVYTVDYNGTVKDSISGRIHNDNSASIYENTFALLTVDLSKTTLGTMFTDEITFQINASFTQTYYSYTIYDFDDTSKETRRASSSISKNTLSIHPCRFKANDNILKMMIFHFTSKPDTEVIYSSSVSYFENDEYDEDYIGKKTNDISYASDSAEQKFDIHIPKVKSHCLPMMVFIHGGDWSAGDKRDMNSYAENLYDDKFITLNINYRLIPFDSLKNDLKNKITDEPTYGSIHLAEMVSDIHSAISYSIKKYGKIIDTTCISLFGYSAGGHLALMYNGTKDFGITPYQIKSVFSIGGPAVLFKKEEEMYIFPEKPAAGSYLTEAQKKAWLYTCLNGTKDSNGQTDTFFGWPYIKLNNISPYNWFSLNKSTHTFFYYGEKDEAVNVDTQFEALRDKGILNQSNNHFYNNELSFTHDDLLNKLSNKNEFDSHLRINILNYCI